MGVLDVINGMQNGPRGQPAPKSNEGMSLMARQLNSEISERLRHFGAKVPRSTIKSHRAIR
jgi:hypothetical protein